MFADQRIAVTIQTADLVDSRMYFVGIENGLDRLITLLTAQADRALYQVVAADKKDDQDRKGDIDLIAIEGHRLMGRDAFLIVGEFFQAAVDLEQHEHDNGQDQGQDSVQERVVALVTRSGVRPPIYHRRLIRLHIVQYRIDILGRQGRE